MSRGSLARRYAPLLAVGVLQLLIIAVVPSSAPNETVAAQGVDTGSATDTGAGIDATTGLPTDTGAPGGPTGTGSVVGGGGVGANTGTTVVGGAGGVANDISHCLGGRQFDPAIDFYAPLCVAKFTGKNPGATYQGVTDKQIEIVVFRDKGNDQVNDILKATGGYVYPEDEQYFSKVAEKFINAHYELYGRKVHIDYFQGTCTSIPPDIACLRGEMDQVVDQYHPYFVKWATTLCSACYEELSVNKKTPNVGGYYFRDEFNTALRPFHWDVQMSGTQLVNNFADLWCNVLKDKPVAYAGTDNPADNKNGKPRKLGVIGTDDDDNKAMIEGNLVKALAKCGSGYVAKYEYKQDINTAATQKAAGVSAMNTNGATDVLCLCDEVAPEFLYQEENQENYYPENLIAGTGFMDHDTSGRSYDTTLCPNGCKEYENALGLSQIASEEHIGRDVAARVWKSAGYPGAPPTRYPHAISDWEYFNMMASMIQATGPNLTPTNMEQAAWKLPAIGGTTTGRSKRSFPRGQYAWGQDMRVVYWSTTKKSSFDDLAGTYVQVDGVRHTLGSYAGMQFALPPKPR